MWTLGDSYAQPLTLSQTDLFPTHLLTIYTSLRHQYLKAIPKNTCMFIYMDSCIYLNCTKIVISSYLFASAFSFPFLFYPLNLIFFLVQRADLICTYVHIAGWSSIILLAIRVCIYGVTIDTPLHSPVTFNKDILSAS